MNVIPIECSVARNLHYSKTLFSCPLICRVYSPDLMYCTLPNLKLPFSCSPIRMDRGILGIRAKVSPKGWLDALYLVERFGNKGSLRV